MVCLSEWCEWCGKGKSVPVTVRMVCAAHHAGAYQEGNREINHPALLGAENACCDHCSWHEIESLSDVCQLRER